MVRRRPAKRGAKSQSMSKDSAVANVPSVYREMLADAVSSSPSRLGEEGRAVKRRRVGGQIVTQTNKQAAPHQSAHTGKVEDDSDLDELFEDVKPNQQSIIQSDSEDSADSDMDWEEVQLRNNNASQEATPEADGAEDEGLNLILKGDKDEERARGSARSRRKPMTAEDRKLRLEIHKMHLCCLVVHAYIRNHWCNDEKVHTAMRKLLTKKMISYLNPDEDKSQFQRSRSFMDGITQASEAFRSSFKVTARGMGRSRWADSPETLALLQPPDDIDLPMQITDFHHVAHRLQASRDIGAQLFCAMLRSAGVDARLVCSLQPLPFQPSQKVELHQVQDRARKFAERKNPLDDPNNAGDSKAAIDSSSSSVADPVSSRRSTSPAVELLTSRKQRRPPRESKYPVYWVEAFNEAVQKWVPVDSLVTKAIAKPSKFEPPAGEPDNSMTYVLAFEDDGSARDVTKRYVKAYNAKTRRERVETSNGGERWWRRIMRMYRRRHAMDRDQLEDAELATKEAAEPMPKNVQDFKDHPYYALERHLRRHEVIHPKREVGKIGAGRAGNVSAVEPIFRRRDVHIVKSADKWYRLGREIKPGEQPLKRIAARRTRQQSLDADVNDPNDGENAGTPLYAAYQTSLYMAPRVVNGLIPKNVYGNLDVYVSSMVPPGGAHIPHPETARAAKILGVDYADAITGFSFKGRHGTAITNGAVVASEYREAIEEVLWTFENDRARAEEQRRTLEALRMWKRLLAGLRVRERIKGYEIEGERNEAVKEEMEKVEVEDEEDDDDDAGGFLPDQDANNGIQPNAGRTTEPRSLASLVEDEGGGFMAEEADGDPATQSEIAPSRPRDPFLNNVDDDEGGGFLVNDDDADAEEALRDAQFHKDEGAGFMEATSNQRHDIPNDSEMPEQDGYFEPKHQELATNDTVDANEVVDNTTIENADKAADNMTNETAAKVVVLNETAEEQDDGIQNTQDERQPHHLASAGLLHEDLEDARMLEQLYEASHIAQPSGSPNLTPATSIQPHTNADGEHQGHQNTGVEDANFHTSTSQTPNVGLEEEPVEDKSPESDKGSLLSHDPEDEDAEPEWLA